MRLRWLTTLLVPLIALSMTARPLLAQLEGQSFEVTSTPDSVTVGDTVVLHLRLHMHERDMLFDTIPQPVGARDPAIQFLSIERMTRDTTRAWNGIVKVAYFRPGMQALPQFGVAFARVVAGIERAVLMSERGTITIRTTLPPGDQPLKDIRPLAHTPSPLWPWLVVPLLLFLGAATFRRVRRRRQAVVPRIERAPVPVADPLADALARLAAIEAAGWAAQGEAGRHYEAVANVVRDYLGQIERTPARELTSSELLRELRIRETPNGALARCRTVLIEADAVKFAAVVPDGDAASGFLAGARSLVAEWPSRHQEESNAAG